jgi:hypothetical protein
LLSRRSNIDDVPEEVAVGGQTESRTSSVSGWLAVEQWAWRSPSGLQVPVSRGYGDAVPAIMLLAAVLAAEDLSFVLVGSAGLYLHGQRIRVRDIDAVPAPDRASLERLQIVLRDLVVGGPPPPLRSLATADLISVRTTYGRLDCLLERGRQDWGCLRAGARSFTVSGVPVLVAEAGEIRSMRARFKDLDDD